VPKIEKCKCGSGQLAVWRYDARNIELEKCCDKCWPKEKKKWRKDVLEDPNYETIEDIDND
jgi:multimeric flavodoxin WrbA